MSLVLRDKRGKAPPHGPHGHPRLDGRFRWLCEGGEAAIARLVRAVPADVATQLTPNLVELWFGNTVGFVSLGPDVPWVEVVAGKWQAGTWRRLTARLIDELRLLPFQSSGRGSAPTVGDVPMERADLYQSFLTLRHLLESGSQRESQLAGAFRSVLARPHQTPVRRTRVVPTALARRVDPANLHAIASGKVPMLRGGRPDRLRGHLPIEVHESVLDQTVDNGENRFALALLREMLGIVFRLRRALPPGGSSWLYEDLDRVAASLEPIRRHSFWRDIGPSTSVPVHSTVLHRRADYRTLFQAHGALRLGVRLPMSEHDLLRMVAQRKVSMLYELWCTFAVLGAVRQVLGPPDDVVAADAGLLDTSLRQGLLATWGPSRVRLSFNPSFTQGNPDPARRSTSLLLRPDVLLETPWGRHALDAKFKIKDGGPKPEDIHKMHAYRDALPIDSAWVLYPGKKSLTYPIGHGISGVGAVPVGLDNSSELLDLVSRMLSPEQRTHALRHEEPRRQPAWM